MKSRSKDTSQDYGSSRPSDDKKSVNSKKTKSTLQFDEFKDRNKRIKLNFNSDSIMEEDEQQAVVEINKKSSFAQIKQLDKDYRGYMFKIIMLGNIAVGKTCILSFFTDNQFRSEYTCTIGCDFKTKTIIPKNSSNIKVDMQIWDTSGEERHRSITKQYYRDAAGIVLVFDVTNEKSFSDIVTWIEEIKTNSKPKCCIVLVGNKTDLDSQRVVNQERAERFAKTYQIPYYETSAKTGTCIEDIYYKLADNMIQVYEEEGYKFTDTNSSRIHYGNKAATQETSLPDLPKVEKSGKCC